MKLWERIRLCGSREIYYYDGKKDREIENFALQLYQMIGGEMESGRWRGLLFLCIGTDRSTGDSLGPLIGYKLKERRMRNAKVLGTLEKPVHAMNLEEYLKLVKQKYRTISSWRWTLPWEMRSMWGTSPWKRPVKAGAGGQQGIKRGGRSVHHRHCGELREPGSPDASEHPAVRGDAPGGLYQREHLFCRKVMGQNGPRLTSFFPSLCYHFWDN